MMADKPNWEELFVIRDAPPLLGMPPRKTDLVSVGLDRCSKCRTLRRLSESRYFYTQGYWGIEERSEPPCKFGVVT